MAALVFDFDDPLPRRLYWDASFLVHATYPGGRYHQDCYTFLERLDAAGDTLSYVSSLALDETVFTLIQLKLAEDYTDRGFWDVYRENPQAIQPYLGELRALIDYFSNNPRVQLVGTEPESMLVALRYMENYSLLPRDALHLSTMARYGIDDIVTTDDDFASVDNLRLHTCNSKILSRTRE